MQRSQWYILWWSTENWCDSRNIDAVPKMVALDCYVTCDKIKASLTYFKGSSAFNFAWLFEIIKSVCTLNSIQFNQSSKGCVKWCKEIFKGLDSGASKHAYDIVSNAETWILFLWTWNNISTLDSLKWTKFDETCSKR